MARGIRIVTFILVLLISPIMKPSLPGSEARLLNRQSSVAGKIDGDDLTLPPGEMKISALNVDGKRPYLKNFHAIAEAKRSGPSPGVGHFHKLAGANHSGPSPGVGHLHKLVEAQNSGPGPRGDGH